MRKLYGKKPLVATLIYLAINNGTVAAVSVCRLYSLHCSSMVRWDLRDRGTRAQLPRLEGKFSKSIKWTGS